MFGAPIGIGLFVQFALMQAIAAIAVIADKLFGGKKAYSGSGQIQQHIFHGVAKGFTSLQRHRFVKGASTFKELL